MNAFSVGQRVRWLGHTGRVIRTPDQTIHGTYRIAVHGAEFNVTRDEITEYPTSNKEHHHD